MCCCGANYVQTGARGNKVERSFPWDIAGQRFIEELYNKETDTRLKWRTKAKDRRADDEGAQAASRQSEVFRRRIEAACPKPTEALLRLKERHQSVSHHKRIRNFADEFQVQSTMADGDLVDMIPPERDVKAQLYQGISRDGKGRHLYLKSRNIPDPDHKYHSPVVSSWQYGWNMSDIVEKQEMKKPEFGRKRLITDTFYTRNGITTLKMPATNL